MTIDKDVRLQQEKNDDPVIAVTKNSSGWVVALVIALSMAMINQGLFLGITGPTLLYLAENTHSDVSQVSATFSGRFAGMFFGEACFSAVVNRYPRLQSLLSFGFALGLTGVAMLSMPFLTSLVGLVLVMVFGGWLIGYLDAGLQAVYLKYWGEKGSRPYIQSLHFSFGVGAFLAPVIATPFLTMAKQEGDSGTTCLGENVTMPTAVPIANTTDRGISSATNATSKFNPIGWSYIITGTYTIVIAVVMCGLALCKVEHKVAIRKAKYSESRQEEPFKDLWKLFVPLCLYYFCCVSSELLYQGYIYAIALCSNLNFSPEQSSWLTAMFSAGFGVGRGSGILTSHFFKPSTIITADLLGTTGSLILMSIWGEQSSTLTWIVTFVHGMSVAGLYPGGVSWSSKVTNMAGSYIFVFAIGTTIGAFVMMPVAGAIYEKNPFYVMYLISGTCITNVFAYILMNVAAKGRCLERTCFT